MNPKPSLSSLKRVFFTPVNHQKFTELREQQERQILRVDLFNIR